MCYLSLAVSRFHKNDHVLKGFSYCYIEFCENKEQREHYWGASPF